VAGAGAATLLARRGDGEPAAPPGATVPFHGDHQAGIASAVQDRLHLTGFDLRTTDRAELVTLLRRWTVAIERMTRGAEVTPGGAAPGNAQAPPDDTGEALDLPAARLTVTVGFGPGLFGGPGTGAPDRFGLAALRPNRLAELPHFAGDDLDPARGGGDLVVQACADDPQVAVHAVRNLARIGFGTTAVRWSQLGFGKTSSTTPSEQTPRNLFGFKDGTRNIAGHEADRLRQHVWIDAATDGAPAWAHGGSYLVMRRIAMRVESWDRTSLAEQERVTGRHKISGAPIGSSREHDPVTVSALPAESHVALAHPDANGGHAILRRGYSFVDGSDGLGRLDAGLCFLAFMRDPATQYVPMQTRMARQDAMAEYLVHTASGLYVIPPGVSEGGYLGQGLFEG
jgi:deferrochelatase/peroxidase EfeB